MLKTTDSLEKQFTQVINQVSNKEILSLTHSAMKVPFWCVYQRKNTIQTYLGLLDKVNLNLITSGVTLRSNHL